MGAIFSAPLRRALLLKRTAPPTNIGISVFPTFVWHPLRDGDVFRSACFRYALLYFSIESVLDVTCPLFFLTAGNRLRCRGSKILFRENLPTFFRLEIGLFPDWVKNIFFASANALTDCFPLASYGGSSLLVTVNELIAAFSPSKIMALPWSPLTFMMSQVSFSSTFAQWTRFCFPH